jgi:hypothetical protein
MGTNYFLFTRSKRLAHTHFASETEWGVTDEEAEIWTPLKHLEYAQKEKDSLLLFDKTIESLRKRLSCL